MCATRGDRSYTIECVLLLRMCSLAIECVCMFTECNERHACVAEIVGVPRFKECVLLLRICSLTTECDPVGVTRTSGMH